MKFHLISLCLASCLLACQPAVRQEEPVQTNGFNTVCNPMNLSYRFRPETNEASRREAADPSIIQFKGRYYLFASKSGGYWYSDNLIEWDFIPSTEIPTEEYAPTAIVLNEEVYFLASSREKSTIYKSADPMTGHWTRVTDLELPVWDPAFHLEEQTEELYLYWGCSNETPIYGVQLDYNREFAFIGKPKELIHQQPDQLGWEVPGDYNERKGVKPWIEGAWMNKHNGTYYLQYSGPGTEFKAYSDGVYTSDHPLGPFELASHNPMAYKPEGFAAGAGHGSTIQDAYGNYWHLGTITISDKHIFERRLGFYPSFFDEEGTLHTVTKFGDYPMIVPNKKVNGFDDLFPGWMLLSYGKNVTISSTLTTHPKHQAVDEDIRTYWAAATGSDAEWMKVDLGKEYDVYALQVNFAEHNTTLFDRIDGKYHRYEIAYSVDDQTYTDLVDASDNKSDQTHVYHQLPEKIKCRYLRIRNLEVPDGNFAISGFRVFGKGDGVAPSGVENLRLEREAKDRRTIHLKWDAVQGATGYNIAYGSAGNKRYHNYTVYNQNQLTINSLHTEQPYFFSIEAFSENGIGPSTEVQKVD